MPIEFHISISIPFGIPLFFTNFCRSFLKSSVIETGLSDYHRMTATVTKKNHLKDYHQTIKNHRDYSRLESSVFRERLLQSIGQANLGNNYLCKNLGKH